MSREKTHGMSQLNFVIVAVNLFYGIVANRTLHRKAYNHNKSPDTEEKFKQIAEAWAIFSDPQKRAQYDSSGFAGVADFSALIYSA